MRCIFFGAWTTFYYLVLRCHFCVLSFLCVVTLCKFLSATVCRLTICDSNTIRTHFQWNSNTNQNECWLHLPDLIINNRQIKKYTHTYTHAEQSISRVKYDDKLIDKTSLIKSFFLFYLCVCVCDNYACKSNDDANERYINREEKKTTEKKNQFCTSVNV